jgi:MFS family permease
VPVVAFTDRVWLVVIGALLWGAAVGIQESTLRAVVADLVAPPRRATAYGLFAAGLGAATAAGGALTGWLYDTSIPALVVTVAVIQIAAIGLAITVIARRHPWQVR